MQMNFERRRPEPRVDVGIADSQGVQSRVHIRQRYDVMRSLQPIFPVRLISGRWWLEAPTREPLRCE